MRGIVAARRRRPAIIGAVAGVLPLLVGLAGCASAPASMTIADAGDPASAGMLDIRTQVPDIDLDMRYAGTDNFVGTRVDGYEAARCFLKAQAAHALARVERELRQEGLRLRIFDCYRPARAVRHFVAWADDVADQRTKPDYYPNLRKQDLLGGYISATSGHSRGATVDLTLMRCDAEGACVPLDMGTGFDFFDPAANTDSPQVSAAQRTHRHRLRAAMERAGFRNYPMEWWHYTLEPEPEPEPKLYYDFVIR